jgi:hypothetical protein
MNQWLKNIDSHNLLLTSRFYLEQALNESKISSVSRTAINCVFSECVSCPTGRDVRFLLIQMCCTVDRSTWYRSCPSLHFVKHSDSRFRFPAGAGNISLHHRVQNGSGAHPASYPMSIRCSFPGGKAAGAWSWPPPSIAEVKEWVALYLHSPSTASWLGA